jgi:hypothetical protein
LGDKPPTRSSPQGQRRLATDEELHGSEPAQAAGGKTKIVSTDALSHRAAVTPFV